MKAVITKNQFKRIKNFINETREVTKEDVLDELTKKQSDTFDVDNDGDIEADDLADLRDMKKISEKKSFPDLTGDGKVTRADILKGRGVELDEKKYSNKASSFIGKEISHLMHDKGYPHDRAVAAAINVAKEKGMKVGKKQMDEDDDCGCGGSGEDTRYMFFSNLEQMMRQAQMLLDMDEDMLEDLLNNGHDWAADHIAEAKNNMDQVFDFIMGEMKGEGEDDSWDNEDEEEEREMVYEGIKLNKKAYVSKELKHHLDNKLPLSETEFRYGSEKHIELLKEVKELYNKGVISLNETDEFMINEFDPKPIKVKGVGEVYLGLIQEEYESDEQLLSEAVYQGRKVQLGKRMRGKLSGKKKFYVFVRNPKTGKVKKITFGQKGVKIKKNNPARRKSFRARHKCSQQKDRLSAAYWSCRAW